MTQWQQLRYRGHKCGQRSVRDKVCLRSYGSSRDCYYFRSLGASFDNPNQWGTLSLTVTAPLVMEAACRSEETCAAFEGGVQVGPLEELGPQPRRGLGLGRGRGSGGPGAESQLSCRSTLPCQLPFTVSKRKKQSSTKVISCLSVNCFPPGRVWGDPGGTVCLRRNTRNVCGCAAVRASHQNYRELNLSLGG